MVLVPLILFSCQTDSSGSSGGDIAIIGVEFMETVQKYLPERYVLSDVAPAPGYHSEKEAFFNTAKELVNGGFLDIISDGEARTWLLECTIEEPVLIHNFRYPDGSCDFFLVFLWRASIIWGYRKCSLQV